MKKVSQLVIYWILLFLPITLLFSTIFYGATKIDERYLNQNINKKLELNYLVDTLGNKAELTFKSHIAIIDFWFVGCAPCLTEMRQFNAILKGREKEITIFSISIDEARYWKNPNSPYLTKTASNWKFYGLDSKVLTDKNKYLHDLFNISHFPSYIVVDQKGKIVEVPKSAGAYIKENYHYKNWILFFWAEFLFTKDYILFQVMFIPYTILFWLAILIGWIIKSRKKRLKKHLATNTGLKL